MSINKLYIYLDDYYKEEEKRINPVPRDWIIR